MFFLPRPPPQRELPAAYHGVFRAEDGSNTHYFQWISMKLDRKFPRKVMNHNFPGTLCYLFGNYYDDIPR